MFEAVAELIIHLYGRCLWVTLILAAHSSYLDVPTERLWRSQLRRFVVKSQFPENAPTHLELLIPLQFHNGAVLEGYHRLIRSPGSPHICAKRPHGDIRSAGQVVDMLVEEEVVAGGHGHPVVGESLQLALPPRYMRRVTGNFA